MAKYIPDKEDENYKFIEEMTGLIMDINPAEISYQIRNDNLKQWCNSWQVAAKMCLVNAPLVYDSKLPEGCACCKWNNDSTCMLMPQDGFDEGCGGERRKDCPLEKEKQNG